VDVYNGHIISLLAFIEYKSTTGSHLYDSLINAAIDTMERYLPEQTYQGQYFAYVAHFPIFPDYGQKRAVLLAKALCRYSSRKSICNTSTIMENFYETKIKEDEKEIRKRAYKATGDAIRKLREQYRAPI
jgi:hypothetical protein